MGLNVSKATGVWVVWESLFDGGCLVFRCSLFMRLGVVQTHLASWLTS